MRRAADLLDSLERFAPPSLAADWDNVGLLLGERSQEVTRAMTCLTVTPETTAEAIDGGAQLIVTHHPILFRAVKRLTEATAEGRMLLSLIRARVTVYCPHTAFDDTAGGINESLASRLGLKNLAPLRRRESERSCKVAVFVPDKDLGRVSDAMFAAGAGLIGQYRECSFRLPGVGTFFGTEATNPTVGAKGRREDVEEWRLEVVCPERLVESVTAAMRKAHSYEEPAFDVYPLHPSASPLGQGRIGELNQPVSLAKLAAAVKSVLGTGTVQMIGDAPRSVQRVAVACGSAGEMLSDAARAKVDVFLTGEMRFHDQLDAQARGVAVLLPGHYATERFGVEELAERLGREFADIRVWASQRERDPVTFV
jgi:dinuclear metal center YbgI/SA1388 family protein